MLAKHITIAKNLNLFRPHLFSEVCRRLHNTHQPKSFRNLLTAFVERNSKHTKFNSIARKQSTKAGTKSTIPIFVGIAAVGGAAAAYYYSVSRESKSSEQKEDEDKEIPYVHENFDEDLALLKEFGPVPYLIIGAGTAAHSAFRAIRTTDPTAKILIIGDEPFYPYLRPPLSKEMWYDNKPDTAETLSFAQYDGKKRSIYYEVEDFYFSIKDLLENKNGGVSVIRGKKVIKIDPESQIVYLNKNKKIAYNKCLIATGSKPENLPVFENSDSSVKKHVSVFRSVADFRKLDKISNRVNSILVVGGGYLGSELACGLAKKGELKGLKVTQVFPEPGNLAKLLPEYLSKWTSDKVRDEGVEVISNVTVKSVEMDQNKLFVALSNDQVLQIDHIVVAVGATPNTDFAAVSGLEVDEKHGGFLVNAEMEARKNLWIAGDSSCFYDMKLGRRRVEHHDHAVVSGKLAGGNMTGDPKPYTHQSMFWSDLGPEIGFEGIGNVDSSLPTVGIFTKDFHTNPPKTEDLNAIEVKQTDKEPIVQDKDASKEEYEKGIVFYLKDNIVVGIILWNVYSKMSIARRIINESKTSEDLTEIAKLFKLYAPDA